MLERLINWMIIIMVTTLSNEEFHLLKKGNPRVFEKIYQLNKKKIYNFLVIKTGGNYDTAEELFSETFKSALDSVHTLKSKENISAWLMKIAYRRFADLMRKNRREKEYSGIIKQDYVQLVDYDQDLIEKEQIVLMRIALGTIKPIYKKVLTMKYIDEESVKFIAAHIQKSVKATESILMRAKNALKTEIRRISNGYL